MDTELKVIIADDEKNVCEGMKNSINWNELNMECVGIATDGKELEELINKEAPQIVITDICMPVKNGLDIIQERFNNGDDIEYIVVSGYNDFEYARTAMRCGVQEYLLKPCSKNEVLKALNNCMRRIRDKNALNQMKQMLSDNENKLHQALERQNIMEIIEGIREIEQCYTVNKNAVYRFIILNDKSTDETDKSMVRLINMGELFFSNNTVVFSGCIDGCFVILAENENVKKILKYLKQIKINYETLYGHSVFSIVSAEFVFRDIRKQYLLIKKIISNSFLYKNDEVLVMDENEKLEFDESFAIEGYDDITEDIKNGIKEKIYTKIESVFENMRNYNLSTNGIKGACIEWIVRINVKMIQSDELNIVDYINKIQNSNSIESIKKLIFENFIELSKRKAYTLGNKSKDIIEEIKSIIEKEYDNSELSIKEIGKNKLFLTPDYISKIFKRKTGISLNRYINIYRIGKAKELIEQNRYKMYEIAQMTGFGYNSQYFSQVFKQITGMSPKEYEDEQKK